jgi:hypothetical protein
MIVLATLFVFLAGSLHIAASVVATAGVPDETYFPQSGKTVGEAYQPHVLRLNSTSSFEIRKIAYSSWQTTRAIGSGIAYRSDCLPSCATGHVTHGPVHFVLEIADQDYCTHLTYFMRVELHYGNRRPAGQKRHEVVDYDFKGGCGIP